MRDPQGEAPSGFYQFSIRCVRLLLTLFTRWRIIGLENVPPRGPLLVVCNHQNNADPCILIGIMPRTIHMMAKQELFEGPVGLMTSALGSFAVRRGQADRQAIKTALDYLAAGSCVGMFPEGTRSRTGGLIEGQPGAGLIAVRSGAPILPIAIAGSSGLKNPRAVLARQRIDIIIGKPFSLPRYEGAGRAAAASQATEVMMRRIADLLPPEMRGVYADSPALPTSVTAEES